jgi:hypothetical protein
MVVAKFKVLYENLTGLTGETAKSYIWKELSKESIIFVRF